MSDLTTIRNIGPAFERELIAAGIKTADQLRETGADAAYARLLGNGTKPRFIGYYVLVMALRGRPWNDCKGDEKKALRKRFEAIKSSNFDTGQSEFEKMLDIIGVVPSKK